MEPKKAKNASSVAWVIYAIAVCLTFAGMVEGGDYNYERAAVLFVVAGLACIAGLFVNGYAMKLKKHITHQEWQRYYSQLGNQHSQPHQKQQPYAKVCESCGAQGRVVPGQVNKCEYCDSFLDKA